MEEHGFKLNGALEKQILIIACGEVSRRANALRSTMRKIGLDPADAVERQGWADDGAKRLTAAADTGDALLNVKHRQVLRIGLEIIEETQEKQKNEQEGFLAPIDEIEDYIARLQNLSQRLRRVDAPELELETPKEAAQREQQEKEEPPEGEVSPAENGRPTRRKKGTKTVPESDTEPALVE